MSRRRDFTTWAEGYLSTELQVIKGIMVRFVKYKLFAVRNIPCHNGLGLTADRLDSKLNWTNEGNKGDEEEC